MIMLSILPPLLMLGCQVMFRVMVQDTWLDRAKQVKALIPLKLQFEHGWSCVGLERGTFMFC